MSNAILWIGMDEARIFHLSEEKMERQRIHPLPEPLTVLANSLPPDANIILLGHPSRSQGLAAFVKDLKTRDPGTSSRIVAFQELEDPSDPSIAAIALRIVSGGASRQSSR